ncbi:putative Thioredoxin-like fold domain-containing protein [Seiridium cardinale]|uniref:Thioredoxin-like fold domain-containing protein n=1 Tax=Seiridium cardinale TaxID=138064 RepID=A0ABR2XPD9_9PEZI
MAVAPKFAGQKLQFAKPQTPATAGVAATTHTLEIYLDYVCPFSAKLFNTLYNTVIPAIRESGEWSQGLEIVFRQQVQPWHPSSTLTHEAAVAVLQLRPEKFWEFSNALFKQQKEFFDVNVVNETRNNTYKRLAEIAGSIGLDEGKVYERLEISDKAADDGSLNIGNKVTNDFKLLVKAARLVGVHVSPTAIFDGIVNNDISSGWGKQEWADWLTKNVVRDAASRSSQKVSNRAIEIFPSTSGAAASKQPGVGAAPGPKYKYPAELQLFHAGVSRITFLACVKLSTILSFAFFTFVVTPRYYEKEGWSPTTIRVALSGVVPLLFVAWTTSPFVLLVSTRLPPFARTSEQYLKRYLSRLPPDAILDITTMSPIAKPRASTVRLSELRPTNRRLGIVNYMRDTSAENATRKWYRFRAVGNFNIQANKTKGPLWLWESVANCISKNKS